MDKKNKLEQPSLFSSISEKIKSFFFVDDDFDDEEYENLQQTSNNQGIIFDFNYTDKKVKLATEKPYQIVYGKENKKEFYILSDNQILFKGIFLAQAHLDYLMEPNKMDNDQVIHHHFGRHEGYKYIFYEFEGQNKQPNDLCYIVYMQDAKVGFELEGYISDKVKLEKCFQSLHLTPIN